MGLKENPRTSLRPCARASRQFLKIPAEKGRGKECRYRIERQGTKPDGILINPPITHRAAKKAVNVIRFNCIGQSSFFLSVLNTFALLTYSLSGTFTREFAMRAATKNSRRAYSNSAEQLLKHLLQHSLVLPFDVLRVSQLSVQYGALPKQAIRLVI